jgi:hypothetical protein
MQIFSEEGRTTSLGLLNYAKEYLKAYEILQKENSIKWISPVRLYLFCHGLELALKAFLKNKKKTIAEIKKMGHDLQKIKKESKEMQDDKLNALTDHDWAVISILNQYYKKKDYEYIFTGAKQYPSEKDLNKTYSKVQRFIQLINQDCSDSNKTERETRPSPSGRGAVKDEIGIKKKLG